MIFKIVTVLLALMLISLSQSSVEKDSDSEMSEKFQTIKAEKEYKLKIKSKHIYFITFDLVGMKQNKMIVDISSSGPYKMCVVHENKKCKGELKKYKRKEHM